MAKGKKTGGRQKGSPNKVNGLARDLAEKLGINPLEILLYFAAGDWESLGYPGPILLKITADGAHEMDRISAEMRKSAASDASKYLYPMQKAVELKSDEGNGIRIVVEDFTSK